MSQTAVALGYPLCRQIGKFEVGSIQNTYRGEEPYIRVVPRNNTSSWSWTTEQRTYFSRKHKTLDEAVQTIREYLNKHQMNEEKRDEDAPKKKKVVQLHVCSIIRKNEGGVSFGIYHKLPGNVKLMLKRGFAKPEDAFNYLREHRAELEEQTAAMKRKPNVEIEVTSERDGKDYRGGRNIDNAEFMETFGISGVTYGNWVNQSARQAKLNATYDALMDLAFVLGIPARAISLNGSLGVQFGASGKGKAKAHYRPNDVSINLTRDKGDGSLAHEWWHALDNYFMRQHADNPLMMTSDAQKEVVPQVMNAEAAESFLALMRALRSGTYYTRAKLYDDTTNGKGYWDSIVEMGARAFQCYVAEKVREGGLNDYLSSYISKEEFARMDAAFEKGMNESRYPYPTAEEMKELRPMFDKFFSSLTHKEGEGGNLVTFSDEVDEEDDKDNWDDALLELPMEIESIWEKTLENVLANMPEEKSDDYYAESVPVCPMPPLFALFGFPNEPIMASPFTFHHAMISKHFVSETEMKKLPRCLYKPIMVLSSSHNDRKENKEKGKVSVVIVADMTEHGLDKKSKKDVDKRVIVPIEISKTSGFGHGKVSFHYTKSVYGKDGFGVWLRDQIKQGRLMYVDLNQVHLLADKNNADEDAAPIPTVQFLKETQLSSAEAMLSDKDGNVKGIFFNNNLSSHSLALDDAALDGMPDLQENVVQDLLGAVRREIARLNRVFTGNGGSDVAARELGQIAALMKQVYRRCDKKHRAAVLPRVRVVDALGKMLRNGRVYTDALTKAELEELKQQMQDEEGLLAGGFAVEESVDDAGNVTLRRAGRDADALRDARALLVREFAGRKMDMVARTMLTEAAAALEAQERDAIAERMVAMTEALLPQKDKHTHKMKKGKMSADAERRLMKLYEMMLADETQKVEAMESLNAALFCTCCGRGRGENAVRRGRVVKKAGICGGLW